MHGILTAPVAQPQSTRLAIWTGLFWIFSYIVLSTRAQLLAIESAVWLSEIRLASITAGALIFGSLLGVIDRFAAKARNPLLFVSAALPASLVILGLRLLMDHALTEAPLSVTDHGRWMLVWTGYFGFGLCAYLIFYAPQATKAASAPPRSVTSSVEVQAKTIVLPRQDADAATWEWVVDVLAEELLAEGPVQRTVLIEHLRSRAGYEIADELGTCMGHNARVRLVERLAARMGDAAAAKRRMI